VLGSGDGERSITRGEWIEAHAPNMNTSYPGFGLKGSYWTRGFDGSWDYGLRDIFSEASFIDLKGPPEHRHFGSGPGWPMNTRENR
jgi:hypothetical protein